MRCDFCGEDLEGTPFQKEGMNFCSLECSDAMETGESMVLGEDVLNDPDEYDEEAVDDTEDEDEKDNLFEDDFIDDEILDSEERY
jgi:hypothetical protein